MASSFTRFTQQRTTVRKTPLDEWSARRKDLYLTTHNTHNRQTSLPPVGFEPTISADERPKTYALDRAATGTGIISRLSSTNKWHPLNRVPEDGRCQGRYRWMQSLCTTKLQSSGNDKREIRTAPSSTASAVLLLLFGTAAQYEAWSGTLQRFSKSLLSAPASCFENIRLECQTTGLLKMIVGVLTTCHTQYTWDSSM